MGTILGSAIISRAQIVLQDTTAIRWPLAELLGWLNDGQREICGVFPELSSVIANITLVAGTKQSLPPGGIALLSVTRNMGVGGATVGNTIRKVPKDILDSQVPTWHTQAGVTALLHYVYDTRAPRMFYVYPPSVVSNQIEATYSTSPTDLPTSATAISIDDIYANPMIDYVLYRAYGKDLELAGNADNSEKHYTKFQAFLSAKKTVDASLQPEDMVKG